MDAEGAAIENPDPKAGLYVCKRDGSVGKVKLPQDHIGFQIGETAQILSGGILQATPHAVRAANVEGVCRSTLAVFMEPEMDCKMTMPAGVSEEDMLKSEKRAECKEAGVEVVIPSFTTRWKGDYDFGTFTQKTFEAYY